MRVRFSLLAGLLAVLGACSTPEPPPTGRLVSAAWARGADSGGTASVYLTIVNADSVGSTFLTASSPLAQASEVHETKIDDGVAHMSPRAGIEIAPRDSLVMKPGGVHVMLVLLRQRLAAGDTLPLTLRFAAGDSVTVRVPVREP